ncbi:hypothetical protein ACPOL_3565 [Acidisarcina polymorpha]|uniref:Uncharacterized protein n=1 Tax=Acidisarcina polymorpha TaxID=2211140 RepID=A0A2Z5G1D8_9BACT|nr:hypothetical protein ACPOL_3565 [Acidisarcina polymorpha]
MQGVVRSLADYGAFAFMAANVVGIGLYLHDLHLAAGEYRRSGWFLSPGSPSSGL